MDIYLKDYIIGGECVSLALSEAVRCLRNGDTLHLGGGKTEFDNICATPQIYYIPRYSNEKKYYTFYFENIDDLTIDGDGAVLVFDGDISPFGFSNCRNITLKDFKIDYKTPYFVQGLITDANDEYVDVKYDSSENICCYDEKSRKLYAKSAETDFVWDVSTCLTNEFETKPKRPAAATADWFLCTGEPHPVYGGMSVLVDTYKQADNHFRFRFKNKSIKHTVGNYLVQANHERKNTDFYFHKCENILMENIDMYASASFGAVYLLCKNVKIDNVNSVIKPDSDRFMAVNADVLHFVNTKGKIEISNCTFENNFDDSVNIHSLFSVVKCKINTDTLLLHFTYLAKKAVNLYSPGEKINVLSKDSLDKRGELTVKKSEFVGEYYLMVEFQEPVDGINIGDLLESETAKPEAHLYNCRAGNNRGRGFLVPAGRKTIVENCEFYNFGCGIGVNGASLRYLEGSAVTDLTVRNNRFVNCARGLNPYLIVIKPFGLMGKEAPPYHRNIRIYDNVLSQNGKALIDINYAADAEIKNNTYIRDFSQLAHEDINETGIRVNKCENVNIE